MSNADWGADLIALANFQASIGSSGPENGVPPPPAPPPPPPMATMPGFQGIRPNLGGQPSMGPPMGQMPPQMNQRMGQMPPQMHPQGQMQSMDPRMPQQMGQAPPPSNYGLPGLCPAGGFPSQQLAQPQQFQQIPQGMQYESYPDDRGGLMLPHNGSFAFIKQDSGEADMFCLPGACEVFGITLPAPGTRLVFRVEMDPQTGRPRACQVRPESGPAMVQGMQHAHVDTTEELTGIMKYMKEDGRFGFIKQDNGETDMFVLPLACAAFGGQLPPVGTRLYYNRQPDRKNGKLTAANVRIAQHPAGEAAATGGAYGAMRGDVVKPPGAAGPYGATGIPQGGLDLAAQQAARGLQQSSGGGLQTGGSGRDGNSTLALLYAIGIQPNDGKVYSGTMLKPSESGKYGFIKPDVGGPEMFVIPKNCSAMFGGMLPPMGARIQYTIITDEKTGRPRADNVALLDH